MRSRFVAGVPGLHEKLQLVSGLLLHKRTLRLISNDDSLETRWRRTSIIGAAMIALADCNGRLPGRKQSPGPALPQDDYANAEQQLVMHGATNVTN